MSAIPPISEGLTVSEFGDRLWGTGPDEAREQLSRLNRERLLELGLTYDLARQWHDFYDLASKRERGLPTSVVRVKLLARCMELLK